jgi:pimeloyl-ACP methyl ester carboxylesterase
MTGERMIRANGVDLCAETFGDAGDPAILLIHGAGNCMLLWDEELCERLAAGARHVIRYDCRGAGRSVASGAFGLRDLVADAAGLLDALGVERAHVLGMSLGGAIAQLLALEHPERVATLILASSTPGGPGHSQPDLPGASEDLYANEPPEPDWSDRASVVDYLVEAERPYAARSRPFDADGMRALAERVFDHSTDIEASLTGGFDFDVGDPWRERLGEVAAPTLVIHGTEDPQFPYAHGVALADAIPRAELLPLEHTGHEYFPRATWDVVVPAILRHTAGQPIHP